MKFFVLGLMCVLLHLPSFGQFNFGAKGGFQSVNAITNTDDQPKWRPSYFAGIYSNYHLSKRVSATAEILYAVKGHKSDQYLSNTYYHRTYLNVPVLVNYQCGSKFNLGVGGEFGFLLSSYAKLENKKVDIRKYYGNPLDVGLVIGVSYLIDSKFGFSLRYIHGLSNLVSTNATLHVKNNSFEANLNARTAGHKYHNQAIQLSLNYLIHNTTSAAAKLDTGKRYVSFGLKGGFNINNTLRENYYPFYSEKTLIGFGGHLGMYMSVGLSEKMSLIPEIQIVRKGYRQSLLLPNDHEVMSAVNLYYVELPVVLSFALSEWISVDVGPVFGQRILVTESDSILPKKKFYTTNTAEFGLTAGFCLNVHTNIAVAWRYYQGFTNISNLDNSNFANEFNQGLLFSTYYRLTSFQ